jgi:hypothetical protein
MPLTREQHLVMQCNRLVKANVSLQNENELLKNALKKQLRNDPTYLNKLQQIKEGAI